MCPLVLDIVPTAPAAKRVNDIRQCRMKGDSLKCSSKIAQTSIQVEFHDQNYSAVSFLDVSKLLDIALGSLFKFLADLLSAKHKNPQISHFIFKYT